MRTFAVAVAAGALMTLASHAWGMTVAPPPPPVTATPPPSTPPPSTPQAQYDAAQAAFDRADWDQAVAGFGQVLAAYRQEDRSSAIIRIRLAEALLNERRFDDAAAAASRGVAELRSLATGPDADLANGYQTLGDIQRLNLAYDDAIAAYTQAKAFAAGDDRANVVGLANVGIVQSAMVVRPDLAASTADALITDPAFAAGSPDFRAQIYALRARAELNRGDAPAAAVFIEQALALSGRPASGQPPSLTQQAVQSDAALIYAKLKDFGKVRRHLADTGAGLFTGQQWLQSGDMDPPVCGPSIAPDDTAVVEFAIGGDGRTIAAAPVWASRPGQTGVEFAKAVREWTWSPQAVALAKPIWREAVRVEMRCATEPPALSLAGPFDDVTDAWLKSRGVNGSVKNLATADQGAATGARADAVQIFYQFRRVLIDVVPTSRASEAAKLDTLLMSAAAPIEARAVALSLAANGGGYDLRLRGATRAKLLAAGLPAIEQASGGQPAAAWLRVEMGVALEEAGEFGDARAPFAAVVAMPTAVLAADDPIRRVAALHLALLDKRLGEPAAAEAVAQHAALTADGCSLLDVHPVLTSRGDPSGLYPVGAMNQGFSGWVHTGYDIAPNGRVKNVRDLVSYPPFIFDDAALIAASNLRFMPLSVGDAPLSCSGQTGNITFAGFGHPIG